MVVTGNHGFSTFADRLKTPFVALKFPSKKVPMEWSMPLAPPSAPSARSRVRLRALGSGVDSKMDQYDSTWAKKQQHPPAKPWPPHLYNDNYVKVPLPSRITLHNPSQFFLCKSGMIMPWQSCLAPISGECRSRKDAHTHRQITKHIQLQLAMGCNRNIDQFHNLCRSACSLLFFK